MWKYVAATLSNIINLTKRRRRIDNSRRQITLQPSLRSCFGFRFPWCQIKS